MTTAPLICESEVEISHHTQRLFHLLNFVSDTIKVKWSVDTEDEQQDELNCLLPQSNIRLDWILDLRFRGVLPPYS